MRWAIGFLLVVNVTIFLWGSMTQGSATKARDWGSEPTVSTFTILSERRKMRTDDPRPLVPPVAAQSGAAEDPADAPSLPDSEPQGLIKVASAPAADEPISGFETAKQKQDGSADSSLGLGLAENVAENRPGSIAPAENNSATEARPVTDSSPSLFCGQVGPLTDAEEAERVRGRLDEAGLRPLLQEGVESRGKGFWVLIPRLADRDEGRRTLARLKGKGVKDMWLFTRGELRNTISLGLYKRRKNAEQRREQLQGLGFQVEVRPRVESVSRFRVSFSGTDPAVLDQVRRLLPQSESRASSCSRAAAPANEL